MTSRKISEIDIKVLWGKSASRCAFENCRKVLVLNSSIGNGVYVIGEMAHIDAYSSQGPRANSNSIANNSYDNLILLCPNCHSTIDKDPNSFSANQLKDIKNKHEAWVNEKLTDSMLNIGFTELNYITNALVSSAPQSTSDFSVIPPREKIKKNVLSSSIESMISMGMVKSVEVESFISSIVKTDIQFPDRLKAGFVKKYDELFRSGVRSDELFYSLLTFSSLGSKEFKDQATGLAILVYLFQKCEVFEH